jgi:hypothetical protein
MNRGDENSNGVFLFPLPPSDVQIFLLVVVLKGKGKEIEAFHGVRACAFGYF